MTKILRYRMIFPLTGQSVFAFRLSFSTWQSQGSVSALSVSSSRIYCFCVFINRVSTNVRMTNMIHLTEHSFKKLVIALAVYLTSLFAANTLGLKIMPFIFGSHLSVAVFSFPVVFLMTDVIGEVYGKRVAKFFVFAGFISTILFIAYSFLSLAMPWSNEGEWARQGYNQIFGISARIAIASIVAFLIAEYQDVVSFFFLREKLAVKYFWLRSLLSNLWSQLLDTTIFMVIAFAGVYSTRTLVSIVITWWLYKVAMGVLYTPLSYLGIHLLKDKKEQTASTI